MRLDELKANFADNIKTLRDKVGLTQLQLGEKLGFSDKTISKWENGDVMPDVATLDHIASYFKITVNDLIYGRTSYDIQKKKRHALIVASTFFGVMALACLCYILLNKIADIEKDWLIFLYSPIAFFVSMIVLSAVFFDYKFVILAVSLLTWTVIIAFFFTFLELGLWMLFVLGGAFQILYVIIMFTIMLYKKKENKIDKLD